MSSEMTILEHMQLAKKEKERTKCLHKVAKEEDGTYNEEPTTTNEVQVYDMYYQVICYAHTLCSSYQIICLHCMCAGHFFFQCSRTYDEFVASYNSSDANSEVIEYVLYEGAHELL